MNDPMVHQLDDVRVITTPDEIPDVSPEQFVGVDVDEPAATGGDWLAEMEAEREAMLADSCELRTYWPTWERDGVKTLVATFRPLEDGQRKRLREAVKAHQGNREEKTRALMCGLLAEACTRLEFKGRTVDDGRGFGPNMARVLQAHKGASTGDLAWLCTKEDEGVFIPFAGRVQEWMADPASKDETGAADDPFGDA